MVSGLKLTAELIGRGPQSVRFHLHSEIALDTVEHQNNGSGVAFLHCNSFLCLKTWQRSHGYGYGKKNTCWIHIEVSRKRLISSCGWNFTWYSKTLKQRITSRLFALWFVFEHWNLSERPRMRLWQEKHLRNWYSGVPKVADFIFIVKLRSIQLSFKIMDHEWLFSTVIRFCALQPDVKKIQEKYKENICWIHSEVSRKHQISSCGWFSTWYS